MPSLILIVDDDKNITEVMGMALKNDGYQVETAEDADEAYAFLKERLPDLILLDFNLPGINGVDLLTLLKKDERLAGIPVIMMTVRKELANKVRGLEAGADDYVVKPVAFKELSLRVKAVLRRGFPTQAETQKLQAEGLRLDLDLREAWVENKRVDLTQAEFDILAQLVRRRGMVMSLLALGEVIAKGGREVTSESVYVHINNLRKKLGKKGALIETIRGVGYKFAPESA